MKTIKVLSLGFLLYSGSSLLTYSATLSASEREGDALPEVDIPRFIVERDAEGTFRAVEGAEGLDEMRQQLFSTDFQRLVIGLRVSIEPDEVIQFGPDGLEMYRESARQAKDLFEQEFRARFPVDQLEYYGDIEEMPYVVIHATPEALDAVVSIESVRTINIESGGPVLLNQSSAFIGAPTAHSAGFTGSGQAIAIIDTGVARNHPMLSGEVVSEACYSTASYSNTGSLCLAGSHGSTITNSGGPCKEDPACGPGHGTHVAGIAAGKSVTPGGIVPSMKGVAYNADVISLMPLSRADDNFSICGFALGTCYRFFESDVAAALSRVMTLKSTYVIPSVNMSFLLGVSASQFSASSCDAQWPAVRDAVALLVNADTAVVAATGNWGEFPSYRNRIGAPACLSKVVSVAATARNANTFQSYSNAAPILDILAPGGGGPYDYSTSDCRTAHLPPSDSFVLPEGIWSAYYRPSCPSGYIRDVGTSMAAPHISAAFALVKAKYPGASITGVKDWLKTSGVNVSFTQGSTNYTRPRVSVSNAMTPPAAPSSGPSNTTVTSAQCYGTNDVSWSSLGGATEYHVQGSSSSSFTFPNTYYQGPLTSAVMNVTHTTYVRVRGCNTVSCGPWSVAPAQAQYVPYCL